MQSSQFPTPVVFVLSLYLLYILSIPDTHDTNACTCFLQCLSRVYKWHKWLQYQPCWFYSLPVPGEGVQHSSHQQRVQDTPCQLIQLPGQQADRKDESWKAKKEEKKTRAKGEERGKGRGMPHSLNNHQSLKKEQEKSEAQHFRLAEG